MQIQLVCTAETEWHKVYNISYPIYQPCCSALIAIIERAIIIPQSGQTKGSLCCTFRHLVIERIMQILLVCTAEWDRVTQSLQHQLPYLSAMLLSTYSNYYKSYNHAPVRPNKGELMLYFSHFQSEIEITNVTDSYWLIDEWLWYRKWRIPQHNHTFIWLGWYVARS